MRKSEYVLIQPMKYQILAGKGAVVGTVFRRPSPIANEDIAEVNLCMQVSDNYYREIMVSLRREQFDGADVSLGDELAKQERWI